MKHATEQALGKITPLLKQIRKFPELKEKKKGIFYKGYIAFLHFHEDGKELFADLKVKDLWKRICVNSKPEQVKLISMIRKILLID